MNTRRIGISLGNIGALHDGLGEFSMQIGQRLATQSADWQSQHGVVFDFHMRKELFGLFGPAVRYLPVTRWQRIHHAQPERYALWHSLHQHNKTLAPRFHGQPTAVRLVTVHDLNHLYGAASWRSWRQQQRAVTMARRSTALVAISAHTAADVRQHLHWTGDISVIHNGARSFVGAAQAPLPGWQTDDPRPFLFHLSRMSASKNPQSIIELARAWPDMIFVLCGPPSEEARKLHATVQLPNLQIHLGINDAQKAWAYAHCTGFLFPSLTEGFGLPPIEAMHFGKPVFLARRTSLPEIGGEAADYFDSFEPQAMQSVVQRGLQRHRQPGRADAIRAHAAQFDWDRAAAAYRALYLRLLDPAAAPRAA